MNGNLLLRHRLSALAATVLLLTSHAAVCAQAVAPTELTVEPESLQLRGGLANCRARFIQEKVGLVVFLGGSITQSPGWTQLVAQDLTDRFPSTKFTFVNAGIPSIDSTGHAFRFTQDVLQRGLPDLIFVEAAVNDLHNGRSETESLRGLEGVIRQARRANRFVDIVGLHFADPAHFASYQDGSTPPMIKAHEKVATHYSIPTLNLVLDIHKKIQRQKLDWARDFQDVHPSPNGHRYYFQGIRQLLDTAWMSPVAANQLEHPLPEAVDPFSYDAGSLVAPDRIDIQQGFELVRKWRPRDQAGVRDGFVDVDMMAGEHAGDKFTLRFEGRAVGFFLTAGPDAGSIEYRIDDGEWRRRETATKWSSGLHLPWLLLLETELESKEHSLELRIADSIDKSRTTLRFRQLAINGPKYDLQELKQIQVLSSLDGTMQPSLLGVPEGASRQPTPLLIYLHSWSSDYKQDNSRWQAQAERRGWIYLHPNFRGVNKQPQACGSSLARQDIIDALDWVQSHHNVDKERIYLAGTSGGGHMALLMASYFPGRFSAVSAWVPISDLGDWYRFHAPDGKRDHYAQMTVDCLGGPPESEGNAPVSSDVTNAYRDRSPVFHLARAGRLPIDIAAGVNDGHTGSVPVTHTLKAFNQVAAALGERMVTAEEMRELREERQLRRPSHSDRVPDQEFGRAIVLRRMAGDSRVTIFDGGHEGLPGPACAWLSLERRSTTTP